MTLPFASPSRHRKGLIGKRGRIANAFTLAEVLAALLFLAIVIPVAVQALQIANRAGLVGERKAMAARIADRLLNEAIITGSWQSTTSHGFHLEGERSYEWILQQEPWIDATMRQLTLYVIVPIQGRDYTVSLSTLVCTSSP